MAQHVAPPFTLTTHTHTPLPLHHTTMSDTANVYKNQLLHVVVNEGDIEVALKLLGESAQSDGHESVHIIEDGSSNSSEGMYRKYLKGVLPPSVPLYRNVLPPLEVGFIISIVNTWDCYENGS